MHVGNRRKWRLGRRLVAGCEVEVEIGPDTTEPCRDLAECTQSAIDWYAIDDDGAVQPSRLATLRG